MGSTGDNASNDISAQMLRVMRQQSQAYDSNSAYADRLTLLQHLGGVRTANGPIVDSRSRLRDALSLGSGLNNLPSRTNAAKSDNLRLLQALELQQLQATEARRALLTVNTGVSPAPRGDLLLHLLQRDRLSVGQNYNTSLDAAGFSQLGGLGWGNQPANLSQNQRSGIAFSAHNRLGASAASIGNRQQHQQPQSNHELLQRFPSLLQSTSDRVLDARLSTAAADQGARIAEQIQWLQAQQHMGRAQVTAASNPAAATQAPQTSLRGGLQVVQDRAQLPQTTQNYAGMSAAPFAEDADADGFLLGLIDSKAAGAPAAPKGSNAKRKAEDSTDVATPTSTKLSMPSTAAADEVKLAKKKRRVMASSHPAMQENDVPHYSQRKHAPLGIEEDQNWLSEFQCFARAEMMEVHQATQADVVIRSTSKAVKLHQVGVRCRFCAHLPHNERVNRSSAFPSRLSKLYQSFNMMVRDHFSHCTEIPKTTMDTYLALKKQNSQGACDSRHYWFYAAQKLGMIDTINPDDEESTKSGGGNGIEMNEATKAAAHTMPPYGITAGEGTDAPTGGLADSVEDLALVRIPGDKEKASPFLYELLSHIQMVRLLPSERVGKRKTLPIGLEGFGCRYCYKVGRLGFSRCYPLRRRGLPAQIYDMHQHLQRCTMCPKPVQATLRYLLHEQEKHRAHGAVGDVILKQGKNAGIDPGHESDYMDLIWSRLGRTCDLTT